MFNDEPPLAGLEKETHDALMVWDNSYIDALVTGVGVQPEHVAGITCEQIEAARPKGAGMNRFLTRQDLNLK